ncbi:MAG: lamin tail domain-containing protein, partial [Verrucomicrobiota bacterium]
LEISTETEGATIYYSIDGSDPGPGSIFVPGNKYTEPLTISETTVVRAMAVKTGIRPTNIDSHTYLFTSTTKRQPDVPNGFPSSWRGSGADYEMDPDVVDAPEYKDLIDDALKALPTLSISTDISNLFGAQGIYDNATSSGFAWEREVSAELIHADGRKGFNVQCGLRMQGGASRNADRSPKHAMSLRFRGQYGPGRLDYPIITKSPQTSFNALHLRARYNNTWHHSNGQQQARAQLMRDQISRDLLIAMGQEDGGHGTYHHLYLNGVYWGIYDVHERMDNSHFADYHGGHPDEIDAINGGRATNGTTAAYNDMKDIVRTKDWEKIQEVLDVDHYIDFFIVQRYGSNQDLKNDGNWKAAGGGPDQRPWRFYCWDTERIFEAINASGNQPSRDPSGVFSTLSSMEEFRLRFSDRVQKHCFNGGPLVPERVIASWMERVEELELAMVAESARWGDYRRGTRPYTRDGEWLTEQTRLIEDYFPARTAVFVEQMEDEDLFLRGAAFNQHGGRVEAGFQVRLTSDIVSIFNPGKIYYTLDGTDPRLTGGEVSASAEEYQSPLALTESAHFTVRVRTSGGAWSALTEARFFVSEPASSGNLTLSEIMYHPGSPTAAESANGFLDSDDFEFLELHNTSAGPIDLSEAAFTSGVRFDFSNGSLQEIPAGGYLILVKNEAAFAARHGTDLPVEGTFEGSLNNGGETLVLATAEGEEILAVTYGDGNSWPRTADGFGFSLVLKDDSANGIGPDSWTQSVASGGSPGLAEMAPQGPAIVISEILANSKAPAVDAIELHNQGPAPVDVSGWFLTDDPGNPTKHALPVGSVIPPNGYLVFEEDTDDNPGNNADLPAEYFGSAFSLSSLGDEAFLFSATSDGTLTGQSTGTSFGPTRENVSLIRTENSEGRIHYTHSAQNTLGTSNATPATGAAVISEIHYHPDDNPGSVEFVEITNPGSTPVSFFDTDNPSNTWRLSGAGFSFPGGITLSPGASILVVKSEPASFRSTFEIPEAISIIGPFGGSLNNDGERLSLLEPLAPVAESGVTEVPYVEVDSVRFNDAAPWPQAADGEGPSLERISLSAYGGEPANWRASAVANGSPGATDDPGPTDPPTLDEWQNTVFTPTQLADANISGDLLDPDKDGLVNLLEYALGGHPISSDDSFRLPQTVDGVRDITFIQRSGAGIQIEISEDLLSWVIDNSLELTRTPNGDETETVTVLFEANESRKFLRLRFP